MLSCLENFQIIWLNLGKQVVKSTSFIVRSSPKQLTQRPWIIVLCHRLLLLGIGSGLAWVLGTVVAVFYPDQHPETPLVIKMLSSHKTARQATSLNTPSTANPQREESQVNMEQRQQLMAQVQQLQADMQVLRDRTQALEDTLGSPHSTKPLEMRLQAIAQQLQTASADDFQSQSPTELLRVTLPSDVLFQDGQSILSSGANLILEKVVSDLRHYQNATISVAVHTDDTGQADDNRELSFQRARAIAQYLSQTLGKQHRLLVIGYGSSRPLVINDTDVNRQRNRRVELIVNL
jgi:outer membrane protein OmpA-like peptidoglycan-associated protein